MKPHDCPKCGKENLSYDTIMWLGQLAHYYRCIRTRCEGWWIRFP
jgi:predicted nucleic-acid-binding Zn-ribbon protein